MDVIATGCCGEGQGIQDDAQRRSVRNRVTVDQDDPGLPQSSGSLLAAPFFIWRLIHRILCFQSNLLDLHYLTEYYAAFSDVAPVYDVLQRYPLHQSFGYSIQLALSCLQRFI